MQSLSRAPLQSWWQSDLQLLLLFALKAFYVSFQFGTPNRVLNMSSRAAQRLLEPPNGVGSEPFHGIINSGFSPAVPSEQSEVGSKPFWVALCEHVTQTLRLATASATASRMGVYTNPSSLSALLPSS
jgi:hypothetical protein